MSSEVRKQFKQMLRDDPALQFVTPWQPQVGDRVRVRVNAECQFCMEREFVEIVLANDGRTGTIKDIGQGIWLLPEYLDADGEPLDPWDRAYFAHDIWVVWDEPREYDDPPLLLGDWPCSADENFLPQELEPVVDEAM